MSTECPNHQDYERRVTLPQTKAVTLFTETTENVTEVEKEESWVLFPDERVLPIAFGVAGLSYTAWRSKPSQLVLGLKNQLLLISKQKHMLKS